MWCAIFWRDTRTVTEGMVVNTYTVTAAAAPASLLITPVAATA